jgi:hypothetical protein
MARERQDREDLLAEAKALVERASLALAGHDEDVMVGFRRDGGASLYFGPARVYHFTSRGELRRAMIEPLLFKAERGQLVSLRRQPGEGTIELLRHDLDATEMQAFLAEMAARLTALRLALAAGTFRLIGQLPPDADVVGRLRAWLDELGSDIQFAQSPRAG